MDGPFSPMAEKLASLKTKSTAAEAGVEKCRLTFEQKMQLGELAIKTVTVLGVVIGGLALYYDYSKEQKKAQDLLRQQQIDDAAKLRQEAKADALEKRQQEKELALEKAQRAKQFADDREQRRKEFATKQKEFGLENYKKRMELYHKLCEVTATIATGEKRSDVAKEIKIFEILYWGNLGLVENQKVVEAQIKFMNALNQWNDGSPTLLVGLSRKLALSCKEHLRLLDEEQRDQYLHEANERLSKLALAALEEGFVHLREKQEMLEENNSFLLEVPLVAGKKYRLIAVGDRDVDDISLEITDETKKLHDKTRARDAVTSFEPATTGNYTVRVRLDKSRDALQCMCSAVILEKK